MSLLENQVGGEKRLAGIPIQGNSSLATPNLQFDSVNNRFIWIATVAASLSEIEFIRDQVKLGNWLEVSGDISTLTNFIEFVPASGKTLFMFRAKITGILNQVAPGFGSSVQDQTVADLTIDGALKDTVQIGVAGRTDTAASGGAGFGNQGDGRFDVEGLSLIGDGIKNIRITNTEDDGAARATMSGFIEDT